MNKRGSVGLNNIVFANEYPETLGFHLTFEDGFEMDHFAGMIDLDRKLIEQHGRVMKSKDIVDKSGAKGGKVKRMYQDKQSSFDWNLPETRLNEVLEWHRRMAKEQDKKVAS